MQDEQEEQNRTPWQHMPDEPDYWFNRFQLYLELGVTRTLRAAACVASEKAGRHCLDANGTWSAIARRWRWRERAYAWDEHQRTLLALSERNMRLALRSRRIERMEETLDAVCEVIDNAHITDADEKLAREWLPQMRAFLRDLLVAERQEFEHGDYTKDDSNSGLVLTADDLRAAQRLLEAKMGPLRAFAAGGDETRAAPREGAGDRKPLVPTLSVCVGPDPGLALDLAALRSVRSATGLRFQRLIDPTRARFADHLRRERGCGRPVELLHIALHAAPEGIRFNDSIADGNWLSERLAGVRILLLACCESQFVGNWLGVVPHVITLSEEINHEDAAALAQHFWHNIGLDLEPATALAEALQQCPPVLSEYVVRHW